MQKFLVIQTAFIGDVVLATAVIEKLAQYFPEATIDFLLRKGNESLLENNPHIHEVLIWNKKENKSLNLYGIIRKVRKNKYDRVINLQRFFSTGLITAFSGGGETTGFEKNPLSFLFTHKVKHIISETNIFKHEVDRNDDLIKSFTGNSVTRPKLYPSKKDVELVQPYTLKPFITLTPSSVWFTKQFPLEKWASLIREIPSGYTIYLLGGRENISDCESLRLLSATKNVEILAGELSFLQSAALMKKARMNYVNDSAPLHFASAVNAPVTAIYCSTIPAFGFTPLSDRSYIVETKEKLNCRPCGLHGKKACPLGHFKCAFGIEINQLLAPLKD